MAFLDRKSLLEKRAVKVQKVDLANDNHVFVKQMTGKELDAFEAMIIVRKETDDGKVTYERILDSFRARLAVCTLCEESGKLLLTPTDVDILNENITAADLQTIADMASDLNKITPEKKTDETKK